MAGRLGNIGNEAVTLRFESYFKYRVDNRQSEYRQLVSVRGTNLGGGPRLGRRAVNRYNHYSVI